MQSETCEKSTASVLSNELYILRYTIMESAFLRST
jgi:hypothetical protein